MQPAGEVSPPLTFAWTGNTTDAVVRVTVEDRAGRHIFDFESRGSSAAAPGGLVDALTPGERFTWKVAALGEDGGVSRASAPVAFVRR